MTLLNWFVFIGFITLCVFSHAASAGCPLSINTSLSAVSLFKEPFLGRMENENRLKEICPTHEKDCVAKALIAEIDNIPVHDAPSGQVIAQLKVIYTPGKGITAEVIKNGRTIPFTPPVYDGDWGYGPWFHATLLDQKNYWKKIALPSIEGGWVKLPEGKILNLNEKDTVYSLGGRHIVILKSETSSLTVRDEQPTDMWCEDGTPPSLKSFHEQFIPLNHLYDNNCNLLLSLAYTRGC